LENSHVAQLEHLEGRQQGHRLLQLPGGRKRPSRAARPDGAPDLGKITAKNIDEWLFRLDVAARVYEDRDGFGAIDREDLTKHIGLETNVIDTTRAGFLRKMTKSLERQGNAAVRSSEAVAA